MRVTLAVAAARQAANQVAKGASLAYAPQHPELSRDYYFKSAEAAAVKLDELCAKYDWTGGKVGTFVRHSGMSKQYVPDHSGYCRPTTALRPFTRFTPVIG